MMRKVLFIAAIFVMATSPAVAFETRLGFGGFGGFHFGALMLNLDGINDYLEPTGADEFGNTMPQFGFEGYGIIFERALLGMTGAFAQSNGSGPDLDASVETGYFLFQAGFILFDYKGFRGYPVMGFGSGSTSVLLEGDYSTLPLAEQAGMRYVQLSDNGRGANQGMIARIATEEEVRLEYLAFIGSLAFHLEYIVPITKGEGSFAFLLTGLRLGATGEIASSGWYIEGDDLEGSEPDFGFNSFSAQLVFAFGGATPYDKETEE
jgi:hypothetical protein